MMPIKAIIFDRDGTLNKSQHQDSHGYVLTPDEMELLPHVQEGLALAKQKGLSSFVFTQQRCVNKGLVSHEMLGKIHQHMDNLIGESGKIEKYYYCPHLADEDCECSKPLPGMILDILADYNLDSDEVMVMGDAKRDWESAASAGVPFVFIKSEKHTDEEYEKTGIPTYENILEAVKDIID
jgi:D-glycero-D-manno-heptose 1,7-bisphosphate phosphatase